MLGEGTLVVQAKTNEDTASTFLSILNEGATPAHIDVAFQASTATGVTVADVDPRELPAGAATRVKVTLTGLVDLRGEAIDGQLVVSGGEVPVARTVSIVPAPHPAADWPTVILLGTLGACLLLMVSVVLRASFEDTLDKLGGRAPGQKWSWDNWATTLTATGAVFGTILSAATLPTVPDQISKDALVQLNVVFLVLLVAGPFLFQAIRDPRTAGTEREQGLWGFSPALLVSYAITGAAVLGELAALALLFWEITGGDEAGWAAVSGFGVLAVLAAYYVSVTTYDQVTTDWEDEACKAENAAKAPQRVVVVPTYGERAVRVEEAIRAEPKAEPRYAKLL